MTEAVAVATTRIKATLDDVVPGAVLHREPGNPMDVVVKKVGVEDKTGNPDKVHRWVVINDLMFFAIDPETGELYDLWWDKPEAA